MMLETWICQFQCTDLLSRCEKKSLPKPLTHFLFIFKRQRTYMNVSVTLVYGLDGQLTTQFSPFNLEH